MENLRVNHRESSAADCPWTKGSARDAWQIISADGGITVIGTDARVYIKNMNTGRFPVPQKEYPKRRNK